MKLNQLPFTRYDELGTLKSLWAVTPSGDRAADCVTGREYAQEWLAYMRGSEGTPGSLLQIVKAMPTETTGIEVAFLSTVAEAFL